MTTTPTESGGYLERGLPGGDLQVALTNRHAWIRGLVSRRYAGLPVFAGMVVVFGTLATRTFFSALTPQTILSQQAVTGLLALGLMFPLVSGIFDLSVAYIAGFAMVLSSQLSAAANLSTPAICAVTLTASAGFGCLSAFVVTRLKINSMVTTLGVGSIALGLTELIASNTITPQFSPSFTAFGQGQIAYIPLPFLYVLALAAVMYAVLYHMPTGRRLAAIGGNPVAARLAGIRIRRLHAAVLLISALIAGFAGLVLATSTGEATSSTAPGFLLPAIAAVFLGATQVRRGPNPWGTVLAIVILGTGIKGLQLLGALPWVSDFFNGAVLLLAVSMSDGGAESIQ